MYALETAPNGRQDLVPVLRAPLSFPFLRRGGGNSRQSKWLREKKEEWTRELETPVMTTLKMREQTWDVWYRRQSAYKKETTILQ